MMRKPKRIEPCRQSHLFWPLVIETTFRISMDCNWKEETRTKWILTDAEEYYTWLLKVYIEV